MSEADRAQVGRIFEIQRFSIHDGPGIRTTVFVQGCPLRCVWCHNPEGIPSHSLVSYQPDRCIGCGHCFRTCPRHAHRMEGDRHLLDRSACVACGTCLEGCYARALELVGRQATVAEVLDEVRRDLPFYETSGGGMTVSGGEPTLQIDFAEALLRAAREEGLHRCVETCGAAPSGHVERLLPLVDLFLFDLKETDGQRHRQFTGAGLGRILENLRLLHDRGARVLLRLPLVPGLNARDDHFVAVAELVRQLPRLEGVEIMPYHRLGTSKLGRLGLDPPQPLDLQPPDATTLAAWIDRFTALGVTVLNRRPAETAAPPRGAPTWG
jgi:pyruvate formate lyase activating enzyme